MENEQATENLETKPWLSWICNSKSNEELRNKYNSWANTYDADVKEDWSFMPVKIAVTLEKFLPSKNATILDAGAGTGLVGQALAQLGYTNITAVDLSEKMLAEAAKKQVYKVLYECNLEDSLEFANKGSFDAIVAAAFFAHAHAGVEILNNLFSLLEEEGIFLLTIEKEYRRQMETALDRLPWTLVSEENFTLYDGAKLIYLLGFKKKRF